MFSPIVRNLTTNKPRGDRTFLIFDRVARIPVLNINRTSPNFQGCEMPNWLRLRCSQTQRKTRGEKRELWWTKFKARTSWTTSQTIRNMITKSPKVGRTDLKLKNNQTRLPINRTRPCYQDYTKPIRLDWYEPNVLRSNHTRSKIKSEMETFVNALQTC